MSADHRRGRNNKRLLAYGAATAVVVAATAGTLAVASPGLPGSRTAAAAPQGARLQADFADAAKEFDVPLSVLMAVSYRQTLWEDHDGLPSTTGAYNVMGLTQVDPASLASDAETREQQLDHMNRSGDPAVSKHFDAKKALKGLGEKPVDTSDPRLHTLDEAAGLIDVSAQKVRQDAGESIRAGAALLAEYQKNATGSLSDDPGAWYPAVARASQATETKGAQLFADRVYASIRTGEQRVTTDGQTLTLPADPSVRPARQAAVKLPKSAVAGVAVGAAGVTAQCPSDLKCDFRPAAYKQNSGPDDWGNYNVANRPSPGEEINSIVIHDTEGSYDASMNVFQNPASYASTNYLIRASDGLVTQVVENKDEAWHAANKSVNMHSIGIEHEGYAIKKGSWYTEPEYESSATLVKYLAAKYGIPLDREHIIGHDEVPGVLDANVKTQHWDPGPFWDWNHYMQLLGAPTGASGPGGLYKAGQVIRVVPPFTTANQPELTNGGAAVDAQPANFGYLYTSPSTTAATLTDPYLGTQTATEGSNWANKVVAGGEYVVAEAQKDWTAIWYGGQKAWFYNPSGQFATAVGTPDTVTSATGAAIPVYGRTYPEDAAYAGTGVDVQKDNSASLTKYTLPAGQKYVLAGAAVTGSYYNSGLIDGSGTGSRVTVVGTNKFYPIRYNHRIAWVRASDAQVAQGAAPDPATDRYDILGRDASGVLWRYQGTGTPSAPFLTRYRVGSGWGDYTALTSMTALRADGTGDMVARDKSGTLWYYKGTGKPAAPFATRIKVGAGWNTYDVLIGARDLTGDGKADLLARDASGALWLYQGTGSATAPFAARTKVGSGWNTYNSLTDTGDVTGDGKADLIGRDASGVLWLYQGTGSATAPFAARTRIGGGWNVYNVLNGPSDLDRDGKADLIGRDASGVLWFYKGTGSAATPFATKFRVGGGWNTYNLIV
ncbi:N-acetylmuramoyl-L-alanine amidase [Streptomyces similanensis]|uniref:N-acetylmuramoyl-L-alanine amidase n=1 Tax=Streptomyces similanensis TaxID=1274988 RepID=A0ABP9JTR6_9ACTN